MIETSEGTRAPKRLRMKKLAKKCAIGLFALGGGFSVFIFWVLPRKKGGSLSFWEGLLVLVGVYTGAYIGILLADMVFGKDPVSQEAETHRES
jgi:hypothetical protein